MGLPFPLWLVRPRWMKNWVGNGLAVWDEVRSHRDLLLHPATVAAMAEAIVLGYIAFAHQLQGAAKWVVFPDESHLAPGNGGPLAS